MLIFKITFSVIGDKFDVKKTLSNLKSDLTIVHTIYFDKNNNNSYGVISFMHPKIFEKQANNLEYEWDFINFLKKNHTMFIKNGATDFEYFTEVYYSGNQCNFELFNKTMFLHLKEIKNISFPISVYHLSKKKIVELLNWNGTD